MTRCLPLWALLAACLAAIGPSNQSPGADQVSDPTIKVVVRAAAEPVPALKYRLLPAFIDRRPGNAAVLYNKIPAERSSLFSDQKLMDKMANWWQVPLADLRKDEAAGVLSTKFKPIIEDLELAGRCETCDWQLPLREQPFWTILLPELQQTRTYGRILAAYARCQIAHGRYDEGVRALRNGYALARHVASGPTLIHGLIGISIASMLGKQVEIMGQQPGAPNLYWALVALPRPLVDCRAGLDAELDAMYLSFPALRDLEKKNCGPEFWARMLDDTLGLVALEDGSTVQRPTMWPAWKVAVTVGGYPRAKRYLIEHGRSAAELEAMPVPQVVLIYSMKVHEELRDGMYKWMALPYPAARKGLAEMTSRVKNDSREIIPIARLLLPAIAKIKAVEARSERLLAALEILEAIRSYGAAHGNRLPNGLQDLDVPIRQDPFRGEPFVYRREGNAAILESPAPDQPQNALRYRIELVGKDQ